MLKRYPGTWMFSFLLFLISASVRAELPFEVNGFASLGVLTSDSAYEFQDMRITPRGQPNVGGVSLLGLNLSERLNENLSLAFQGVTTDDNRSNLSFVPDWYNVRYSQGTLAVRVGKLRTPLFLYSEQLDIGVTYPWLRPVGDVYSIAPVRSMDGAIVSDSWSLGSYGEISASVFGGISRFMASKQETNQFTNTIWGTAKDVLGATLTWGDEPNWILRASYLHSHTNLTSDFEVFGDHTYRSVIDLGSTTFQSYAFRWNQRPWLFIVEAAGRESASEADHYSRGAFATVGRMLGKFTLAYTYASNYDVASTQQIHPSANPLTTVGQTQYEYKGTRSSYVDLRYDFTDRFCGKLEVLHSQILYKNADYNAVLTNFGASLDMVF